MDKKVYRGVWCGSSHYAEHVKMLEESHKHFEEMIISGEIKIDVPTVKSEGKRKMVGRKFKTIRIFGKEMRLTIEEYNTHYVNAQLK